MRGGEFIAMGVNKSLRDLVRSTFSGTSQSPISTVGSNSTGVLRFLIKVLSNSRSRGINSKFKDL
jgi:hypothetical protein